MIRLAVNGASGRMGTRICALAEEDSRFELTARISRKDLAHNQTNARNEAMPPCDVVIDFSSEQGTQLAIDFAVANDAALLVGTTGLSQQTAEKMAVSAESIAVMYAPNTSRGVAVLCHLIAEAAKLLGSGYAIDVVDVHHAAKRDAPSGTALRLVQSLHDHAGVDVPAERVHSIRAGDVIGDHDVLFAGPGERIKISHSATTRDVFALGALDAAAWLHMQRAGLYNIEQSLGLST